MIFASGAKKIQNKPKINEDPIDAKIREFQGEIDELKNKLLQVTMGKKNLSKEEMAEMAKLLKKVDINNSEDMDAIKVERVNELNKKKEDIENRRKQLADLENKGKKSVDNDTLKFQMELNEKETKLKNEEDEINQIVKQMESLNNPLVRGEADKKKLSLKKNELEKIKMVQAKEDMVQKAVEKAYQQHTEKKNVLEVKHKNLQEKLSNMDKEIVNSKKEIVDLSGKMVEFKSNINKEKDEYKREKDLMTRELKFQEALIKSLVPHSVESILTTMIDWDDNEQKWDLKPAKTTAARFDKPFS